MFANDEIRDTRDERRTKRTAFLSILRDLLPEAILNQRSETASRSSSLKEDLATLFARA